MCKKKFTNHGITAARELEWSKVMEYENDKCSLMIKHATRKKKQGTGCKRWRTDGKAKGKRRRGRKMTWVKQETEGRRRKQDKKYAHSVTNLVHLDCYCLLNDNQWWSYTVWNCQLQGRRWQIRVLMQASSHYFSSSLQIV